MHRAYVSEGHLIWLGEPVDVDGIPNSCCGMEILGSEVKMGLNYTIALDANAQLIQIKTFLDELSFFWFYEFTCSIGSDNDAWIRIPLSELSCAAPHKTPSCEWCYSSPGDDLVLVQLQYLSNATDLRKKYSDSNYCLVLTCERGKSPFFLAVFVEFLKYILSQEWSVGVFDSETGKTFDKFEIEGWEKAIRSMVRRELAMHWLSFKHFQQKESDAETRTTSFLQDWNNRNFDD